MKGSINAFGDRLTSKCEKLDPPRDRVGRVQEHPTAGVGTGELAWLDLQGTLHAGQQRLLDDVAGGLGDADRGDRGGPRYSRIVTHAREARGGVVGDDHLGGAGVLRVHGLELERAGTAIDQHGHAGVGTGRERRATQRGTTGGVAHAHDPAGAEVGGGRHRTVARGHHREVLRPVAEQVQVDLVAQHQRRFGGDGRAGPHQVGADRRGHALGVGHGGPGQARIVVEHVARIDVREVVRCGAERRARAQAVEALEVQAVADLVHHHVEEVDLPGRGVAIQSVVPARAGEAGGLAEVGVELAADVVVVVAESRSLPASEFASAAPYQVSGSAIGEVCA